MDIGIFGGTFDPPHLGHLVVVEAVSEQLNLERTLFIPAAIPPHKTGRKVSAPAHRVEMTRRAIADNPRFDLSEIEISRKGESYTVDTLNELRGLSPQEEFFLIIGADELIDFHTWKSPSKILECSQVVVLNRLGSDLSRVEDRLIRRVVFVDVPNIEISSTEIRERVREGKSIKYLVPASVEEYILHVGIYST
jgi:nicotinate-nucleotide adenylyltransferase